MIAFRGAVAANTWLAVSEVSILSEESHEVAQQISRG